MAGESDRACQEFFREMDGQLKKLVDSGAIAGAALVVHVQLPGDDGCVTYRRALGFLEENLARRELCEGVEEMMGAEHGA